MSTSKNPNESAKTRLDRLGSLRRNPPIDKDLMEDYLQEMGRIKYQLRELYPVCGPDIQVLIDSALAPAADLASLAPYSPSPG